MARRLTGSSTRPLAVLLPLVLVLVSLGSFGATRRVVAEQDQRLLGERAATIEGLLNSTLTTTVASLTVLGQIAVSPEPSALQVFTRVARQQPPGSLAVGAARQQGTRWTWLAGAGDVTPGAPVAGTALSAIQRAARLRTLVASVERGAPPQVLLALAVGPDVVFQKYSLGPTQPGAQGENPFAGVDIALYDAASGGQPVFATRALPFPGRHADRPITIGADTWRIEVAAKEPLVGTLTQRLPWLVLAGGLVTALLLWVALTTVTRRREYAERLVVERTGELEQARAFRENLLRLGPTVVARTRLPDGALTYVSPNASSHLELDAEALADAARRDALVHPDDRPRLEAAMRAVAEGRSTHESLELRLVVGPGRERWIHEDLVPERDPASDEVVALIAYVHDITEQRRAADELLAAHQAAQKANQAKSAFLSRMSHELRTPLNSVLGFAQLLEKDDLRPDQRESVGHILSAGRHLLALIDEVLDLSRIEAGTMSLSLEPVLVADVVRECLELMQVTADAKQVRLEQLFATEAPAFARADQQRVKQVLLNLLTNAVKYNVRGGTVTVSVVPSAPGNVLVTVADTGPGIPVERQHELFKPFHRLGAELSGVEGTGIGLALSRQLAEAMGGSVGVDSEAGKGSAFWLLLPAAEQPPAAATPVAATVGVERPCILQIEDNPSNIRLLQRALRDREDLTLVVAETARHGLAVARTQHPRLVLLDVHLPDLDGPMVLRLLKKGADTADIPVVVVTADATPEQREQLLEAGAQAYVTKPYDVDELLGIIDAALVAP